jgi:hypothetical protein
VSPETCSTSSQSTFTPLTISVFLSLSKSRDGVVSSVLDEVVIINAWIDCAVNLSLQHSTPRLHYMSLRCVVEKLSGSFT